MKVGIIRYPGSNCDYDALKYFENSFFIWHKETELPEDINLLVIPGGFAFGDRKYSKATGEYIISPGDMAIDSPVTKVIFEAYEKRIPILGICNGFQILTKLGLLPGRLSLHRHKRFICKKVDCHYDFNRSIGDTQLYIANSFGKYECDSFSYEELKENNQIFLEYTSLYKSKTNNCIAGICNKDQTVYGMMPHPERNNIDFKEPLLRILKLTNNFMKYESRINNLLNSEHISYKSTKKYLSSLHTKEPWVVQGPGENAGIIDIGKGYCIAIRIESHNHPTFINAFEGAATGVGGILRDIFTMGARPIGILDFLRFGKDKNSHNLLTNAIDGISYYGNCVGVPNLGGDLYLGETYNKNPLVNVGCLGIVKRKNIIYGNALDRGNYLVYVGSKTGCEGINGAAMASNSFSDDLDLEKMKEHVQKSDPFLEKLLLEACCELAENNLAVGMQDMGAGGLLCASYEVVHRGRAKTSLQMGCKINIDKVPTKYEMDPCDILISESQERMLIVANRENLESIFEIFEKWDLEYAVIGETDLSGKYEVYSGDDMIYCKNMEISSDISQDWKLEQSYKKHGEIKKVKKMSLWQVYDSTVGSRTIKGPDKPGSYSILDLPEVDNKLLLSWGESFTECHNVFKKLAAKPMGIVNCLNFGHPEDSMYDFAKTIENLNFLCKQEHVPVLGGNVSLYNSTDGNSIKPTPIFLMVGLMD